MAGGRYLKETESWQSIDLPNIPFLYGKLDKETVKYLWKRVKKAEKEKVSYSGNLAGNISSSLEITDKDNFFYNKTLKTVVSNYFDNCFYKQSNVANINFGKEEITGFCIRNFWVNYQKKYEFNPLHNHTGVFSFVVWLQIPFEVEDQKLLVSKSNSPCASTFQFVYTDILGQIRNFEVSLGSANEGEICLFPHSLCHQVYPFFNCKKDRISLSGNIHFVGK